MLSKFSLHIKDDTIRGNYTKERSKDITLGCLFGLIVNTVNLGLSFINQHTGRRTYHPSYFIIRGFFLLVHVIVMLSLIKWPKFVSKFAGPLLNLIFGATMIYMKDARDLTYLLPYSIDLILYSV
jgi:hypothetical protein